MDEWLTELEQHGFAVIPKLLSPAEIANLIQVVAGASDESGVRKRSGVYAIRNLLDSLPEFHELSTSEKLLSIARAVLGPEAIPVKGTLFDKTADANWLVPWHQDLTITVSKRAELEGYGPWTIKAGAVNVQPPTFILQRMLAIRIHLDSCDESNGALRVLPGSHNFGRLSSDQIQAAQTEIRQVTCAVPSGGAVLMRPLLLHASSPAVNPAHRRVVHIDYAAAELPQGVRWITEPQPGAN